MYYPLSGKSNPGIPEITWGDRKGKRREFSGVLQGLLNIGETMTSAVIKALKKHIDDRKIAILMRRLELPVQ